MKKHECKFCNALLGKDTYALNLKLLGKDMKEAMCLPCFADYLGCETEDLLIKIEELKEQGCTLFK